MPALFHMSNKMLNVIFFISGHDYSAKRAHLVRQNIKKAFQANRKQMKGSNQPQIVLHRLTKREISKWTNHIESSSRMEVKKDILDDHKSDDEEVNSFKLALDSLNAKSVSIPLLRLSPSKLPEMKQDSEEETETGSDIPSFEATPIPTPREVSPEPSEDSTNHMDAEGNDSDEDTEVIINKADFNNPPLVIATPNDKKRSRSSSPCSSSSKEENGSSNVFKRPCRKASSSVSLENRKVLSTKIDCNVLLPKISSNSKDVKENGDSETQPASAEANPASKNRKSDISTRRKAGPASKTRRSKSNDPNYRET